MAMLVRLKPINERKGFNVRTYMVEGARFYVDRGWYEVDDSLAERLSTLHQNYDDPDSPPLFDVMTRDAAEALEQSEIDREANARASASRPATAQGSRRVSTPGRARSNREGEGDLTSADVTGRRQLLDPDPDGDELINENDEGRAERYYHGPRNNPSHKNKHQHEDDGTESAPDYDGTDSGADSGPDNTLSSGNFLSRDEPKNDEERNGRERVTEIARVKAVADKTRALEKIHRRDTADDREEHDREVDSEQASRHDKDPAEMFARTKTLEVTQYDDVEKPETHFLRGRGERHEEHKERARAQQLAQDKTQVGRNKPDVEHHTDETREVHAARKRVEHDRTNPDRTRVSARPEDQEIVESAKREHATRKGEHATRVKADPQLSAKDAPQHSASEKTKVEVSERSRAENAARTESGRSQRRKH